MTGYTHLTDEELTARIAQAVHDKAMYDHADGPAWGTERALREANNTQLAFLRAERARRQNVRRAA